MHFIQPEHNVLRLIGKNQTGPYKYTQLNKIIQIKAEYHLSESFSSLQIFCYHSLLVALKFNIWLNNFLYVQLNFNICLIRQCMVWKAFAQHSFKRFTDTDRMHHIIHSLNL